MAMIIAGENGEVELSANHKNIMGIYIYSLWPEFEGKAVLQAQAEASRSIGGHPGHITESYRGPLYPSYCLVPEAFENPDGAIIPAAVLRERLRGTLRLAEEREREVYGVTEKAEIERVLTQYRDFVKLCETVEAKLGRPPTIIASW